MDVTLPLPLVITSTEVMMAASTRGSEDFSCPRPGAGYWEFFGEKSIHYDDKQITN